MSATTIVQHIVKFMNKCHIQSLVWDLFYINHLSRTCVCTLLLLLLLLLHHVFYECHTHHLSLIRTKSVVRQIYEDCHGNNESCVCNMCLTVQAPILYRAHENDMVGNCTEYKGLKSIISQSVWKCIQSRVHPNLPTVRQSVAAWIGICMTVTDYQWGVWFTPQCYIPSLLVGFFPCSVWLSVVVM